MRTKAFWGLALTAVAVELLAYRRWHLRWGATNAEVEGPMPGDELMPPVAFTATRAITIEAPPECIWPWLMQVGFKRGGFYSYDLLDNLGRPSVREVLPQYQELAVGDLAAPMADPPNDATAFRIAELDEPRSLVWAKPDSTWAWRLTPTPSGGTRLVTRLKSGYELGPSLPMTIVLAEVGDFPMMRRMLLGLKERAETT